MQQVLDQEQVVETFPQEAEPKIVELPAVELERIGGGAGNVGLSF